MVTYTSRNISEGVGHESRTKPKCVPMVCSSVCVSMGVLGI